MNSVDLRRRFHAVQTLPGHAPGNRGLLRIVFAIAMLFTGCTGMGRRAGSDLSPKELGYAPGITSEETLRQETDPEIQASTEELTVRGQSPEPARGAWGEWDGTRPMPASRRSDPTLRTAQADGLWTAPGSSARPSAGSNWGTTPGYSTATPSRGMPAAGAPSAGPPQYGVAPPGGGAGAYPQSPLPPPSAVLPDLPAFGGATDAWLDGQVPRPPGVPADVTINVDETTTGRFMVGAGVNSDAGVTGQIVLDEQNFEWRRFPHSVDEIIDGRAFRGGGQRFRIEAMPGTRVQRYMVNFVQPFVRETPISLSLSGFLFDRNYFDWDERRLGGRLGLGYRITPDLSVNVSGRGENVNIRNPRIRGVADLEEVLGDNELWGGKVSVAHDTRDSPFMPTSGRLIELSYEQVFGQYDYPIGTLDYRRYILLAERPDLSGRHVLGNSIRFGVSGSDTPLFEHFFAGGHTTMRGFDFRGASPKDGDVTVGGTFSILGSTEYLFPITADDMLKGVFFVDYGTIEEDIEVNWEDFRVVLGFGLRISVPAMGPAPIALDLGIPVAREDTDDIQNFSFNMGMSR